MIIYLDTNVWSRPFDRPSKRIIEETIAFFGILERAFKGELKIVSSVVLEAEISNIDDRDKKVATERLMAMFSSKKVYTISSSKVREIKESTGLKLPDAAHLACAIEAECKYFITCDEEIVKRGKDLEQLYGLKIYNPVKFTNIGDE